MAPSGIRGPDLAGVVADADAVGLEYVVIGGFAVIAHGYFRVTKDSDLLVPDPDEIEDAHHLRVESRHGVIDIMRGGLAPLDYDTVAERSIEGTWRGNAFRVAALRSLVGFKRLAGRGQDKVDLEKLESANGELPIDPIPGLDS